jgi:hypothetical protein
MADGEWQDDDDAGCGEHLPAPSANAERRR